MPEIIEKLESRAIQSSGGRGTGSRKFFASGYSNPKQILETFGSSVGTLKVPDKGQPYPDLPGLIAKDFSITPVQGQSDVYEIDWQYEMMSVEFLAPPEIEPPSTLPNEVDYVEFSMEIRTEFQLAWRSNPNSPSLGEPDPDDDIGGTPIDAGGNPTSIMRRRQELVVTETVNSVDFATISNFTFKRNNATFLGTGKGSTLYRGASVRRTGVQVFIIAHSFVHDQFFHMEQQPLIDQNGVAVDKNNDGHADEVYFVQPFPDLADFNALSRNF
tara:strand:+ start:209 stop:1024 length:816 start_codon:yes stop_codon:yes gene_type:complete